MKLFNSEITALWSCDTAAMKGRDYTVRGMGHNIPNNTPVLQDVSVYEVVLCAFTLFEMDEIFGRHVASIYHHAVSLSSTKTRRQHLDIAVGTLFTDTGIRRIFHFRSIKKHFQPSNLPFADKL